MSILLENQNSETFFLLNNIFIFYITYPQCICLVHPYEFHFINSSYNIKKIYLYKHVLHHNFHTLRSIFESFEIVPTLIHC